MAMHRLWVEETTTLRKKLEDDILQLLKAELALLETKKILYQQYRDLMDNAANAYANKAMQSKSSTTP
jgi:hypothetical protein